MRLLVTGAAGFIGHHFCEHVLRNHLDWEVVGTASFRHRGCPLRLKHLMDDSRLQLVTVDHSAPVTPRVAEAIGPVDAIVNFAADSHVDRSIADPAPFVRNNVDVALSLLEYARTVKPLIFLQFSTDEVYGPARKHHQHREWEAIIPSNPYSASKAAQEAVATSFWRTYQVPVVIVNSMNLIGERQDPEKFLPKLIRSIQAGEAVPIHGRVYGDPWHQERGLKQEIGSRMYLHARNLADGLCWLLERAYRTAPGRFPEADRPDRWHVVGEREVSNLELAELVAATLEKPLHWKIEDFHGTRPGHDMRYALDGSKIREAGWVQPLNLEASLEKTVRWTLAHQEWLL